jgi:hypothetical protein
MKESCGMRLTEAHHRLAEFWEHGRNSVRGIPFDGVPEQMKLRPGDDLAVTRFVGEANRGLEVFERAIEFAAEFCDQAQDDLDTSPIVEVGWR